MKIHIAIFGAVVAAVVLPFLIAGREFDARSLAWLRAAEGHPNLVASAVVTLLAADVVLPVPSSIVSTSSGAFLGFLLGAACSTAGMTLGCIVGYAIGAWSARAARRVTGDQAIDAAGSMFLRHGEWAVIAGRAVPVIAESTTIYAGIFAMPFGRFLVLTTLANAGTSMVYAGVGAYAAGVNSFLFAFVGSMALPLAFMWLWRAATDRIDRRPFGTRP